MPLDDTQKAALLGAAIDGDAIARLHICANALHKRQSELFGTVNNIEGRHWSEVGQEQIGGTVFEAMAEGLLQHNVPLLDGVAIADLTLAELADQLDLDQDAMHQIGCACFDLMVSGADAANRVMAEIEHLK